MSTVAGPSAAQSVPRRLSGRPAIRAGMTAGPLFVAVSFAQVPFRDGFDVTRHAFSFLLLGPGGWLQTVNFVLAGGLYIASGAALHRVLSGRAGRWAQASAIGLGVGLVVGGLFPPTPSFGYPAGAPAGFPDQISTSGIVHGAAFVVGMASWCAVLLVLAWWLNRHGLPGWATLSGLTAIALLAVPAVTGRSFATALLYIVVTAAYFVTSLLFGRVHAVA